MLDDDRRPVGPGTRLLTVLVAPFVAVWMVIDASVELIGRLVRHSVRVVIDSLRTLTRGMAHAGRAIARRAVALVAAILGLAGELPHVIGALVGPAVSRIIEAIRSVAHATAAIIRAVGRSLDAIVRRLWVALRAMVTIVLRPFRWAGHILAPLVGRAAVIVRAFGHGVAAGLRSVIPVVATTIRRVGFVLATVLHLVARALRGLGSAVLAAIRLAERAIRRIWQTIRLAMPGAARAIRSSAARLVAIGASVRMAIRSALRDARSSVRVAIGDARRSIGHAFSTGRKPAGPSK